MKVGAETEWSPLRADFFLVRTYYNKRNPRTTAIESNLYTLPPERRFFPLLYTAALLHETAANGAPTLTSEIAGFFVLDNKAGFHP
ncbi:hypothetical protein [Paenibacillus antibioticophila]|uniref:hypothetical protein n=1 Tax=Paenibacillus antibioticophila TaxID=1274374 RepID=UPI001BB360C5|nr:hypothetical protein [Paenibacillus antibioticophila]